jgi:polyphenol oxidase
LEILETEIFDKNLILAGVTQVNKVAFPPTGLSLAPSGILNTHEFERHLGYFSDELNVPVNRIKFNHQVHSDIIYIADSATIVQDGDALITNEPNLLLLVKLADCAGVLMHDGVNNVIAAVHSGWRGTKQKIVPKTIDKMSISYGTNPEDLKVYLSPMAQQKNYEVQSEFIDFFPKSVEIKNGRYFFSNAVELKFQLVQSGVSPWNIEDSGICTIENSMYHSYRRDGNASGRMAAFIMMR